ncbi:acyl-CoA thioesterase [Botrimarina hoheduenensis]|uniref:Acyl-CoA thioester hydrolase YbgC n=1 Tax=Botrimarina hoheduenensis TaxID=2528000 RepID=A0A5C5VZA1_9BACT|nr:thioesterase family protein [Botrimarina hoheduenensis]TWT43303.1 Acyl-CoA thioester hydrolase YbgC [Botrimarina hoheduenensis]
MPATFRFRRMVDFSDTDMAGIMHFAAFFRFMESAEHALLRSLGLSIYQQHEEGVALSFPRVSARCDYHSPARCENELDIEVVVHRLGTSSITYGFRFSHADHELAVGEMTSVCCLIQEGVRPKPTPLPQDIVALLKPYLSAS